jgi:hypothetical protein
MGKAKKALPDGICQILKKITTMGLYISILGAISAILVSMIGAWLANRNSIVLQTR